LGVPGTSSTRILRSSQAYSTGIGSSLPLWPRLMLALNAATLLQTHQSKEVISGKVFLYHGLPGTSPLRAAPI